jgi:23S rRNA pseudouridine2605 synthase
VTELDDGERLQKVLARAGFGSRRVCEILITAGRVRVDGKVAELGRRVGEDAVISVDNVVVPTKPDLVYYLLNKPVYVVTTANDPEGRHTVMEFVPVEPRVFPVGRLDFDTEGLLILTNDGDLAQRLTHPSFGVEKEYLAEVQGKPEPGAIRMLRDGIELEDGMTAPAKVSIVQTAPGHETTALSIVIHEGRKRQVRRMCEAIGHPVVRLVRTRIASLADRGLQPGAWRPLGLAEVRGLYEASQPPKGTVLPAVAADPAE